MPYAHQIIMILPVGIVFVSLVVADLHPEQRNRRKIGLEINLSYGSKGTDIGNNSNDVETKKGNVRHGSDASNKINGQWDAQGYVYNARAKGSFKIHSNMATWIDARQKCYEEGAELVSPETEVLLETMSTLMMSASPPVPTAYTGINDLYHRGIFTSIRGIPLAHMPIHWRPDHKYLARHNCLTLHHNGLLYGEPCASKNRYICYKRELKFNDVLCGNDYIHYKPTHTCYKFHLTRMTWSEAYATCSREQSQLHVVNTDDESRTVLTTLFKKPSATPVHLGATIWRNDLYMTVNGEPVDEKRFYGSQQVSKIQSLFDKRKGCLMLLNETFHKVNCTLSLMFICEKTPNKL